MRSPNLAPPITKENAAEYARRATISRERKRAARKAQILASPDLHARKEVEREITRVMGWMRKSKSHKEYASLARTLDSLWKKAFPEIKATKSSASLRSPPMTLPVPLGVEEDS